MPDSKFIDPQKGEDYCFFYPLEDKFRKALVPPISKILGTYHLTYLTLLWSAFLILFGWLANENPLWLIGSCLAILMQWGTDLLDGAVGRYKKTGLVKWGFYADHFFDYIFMVSILLGYHFFLTGSQGYNPIYLFIITLIFTGFMISSYLYSGITKKVIISFKKIGPSEGRFFAIIINILVIIFGKELIIISFPYLTCLSFIVLAIVFYKMQKNLWEIDMKIKKQLKAKSEIQKNVEQLWN